MAFKFVLLAAFVACANAGLIPAAHVTYAAAPLAYAAPIAKTVVTKTVEEEHDSHPQYSFSYGVQDSISGDVKQQSETRDGDVVRGSYSLLDSDGSKRTVDYTADSVNGFNAVVRKEQPAQIQVKAAVVKTIAPAPVVASAPILKSVHTSVPVTTWQHQAAPTVIKSYAAAPAVATYAAPALTTYAYAAPLANYAQSW